MLLIWIHLLSSLRLRGFVVCALLASVLLSGQFLLGETFSVTVSGVRSSPGNSGGSNYSSYTVPAGSLYTFTLKSVAFSVSNSDGHSFYLSGSYDAEWNNGYESGLISKPGNAGINYDPCSFQVRTWDYSTRIDFNLTMSLGWNDVGPSYYAYQYVVNWEIDDGSGSGDDDDDNPPSDDDDDNPPSDDDDDNPPSDDDDDNPPSGDDDDNPPSDDDDDNPPSDDDDDNPPSGDDDTSFDYKVYLTNPFSFSVQQGDSTRTSLLNVVDPVSSHHLYNLDNYITSDSFSGSMDMTTSAGEVLGSLTANDINGYSSTLSTKIGSNPYSKLGYNNLLLSYQDNNSFASESIVSIPQNLGGTAGNGYGFPDPVSGSGVSWGTYAYYYAPLSKALFRFVLYLSLFIYIIRKFGWD